MAVNLPFIVLTVGVLYNCTQNIESFLYYICVVDACFSALLGLGNLYYFSVELEFIIRE